MEVTETVPMHIVGSGPVTNTVIENKDATDSETVVTTPMNAEEKDSKDKDAAIGKNTALICALTVLTRYTNFLFFSCCGIPTRHNACD